MQLVYHCGNCYSEAMRTFTGLQSLVHPETHFQIPAMERIISQLRRDLSANGFSTHRNYLHGSEAVRGSFALQAVHSSPRNGFQTCRRRSYQP